MARKFIVDDKDIKKLEGNNYVIYGSEVNHIKAMRHEVGNTIDINNVEYMIEKIEKEYIEIKYIKMSEVIGVPSTKITLYQALVKSDKMEYIIQKAVELGITEITPVISKNVVIKLDEKDKVKKIERWNKISQEATKQCGRSDIVKVNEVINLKEISIKKDNFDYILLAYEEDNTSLRSVIEEIKNGNNHELKLAIIIGAEGGFDKEEVEFLKNNCNNLKLVSLGDRVLRAETASLNLLSILMYEF